MAGDAADKAVAQLLSYPILWAPDKIISFLLQVHRYLETAKPEILVTLNTKARSWGVLEYQDEIGNSNWGRGFCDEELSILTNFYTTRQQHDPSRNFIYKFDCVTDLVKVIRHKYIHQKDFPEAVKEYLFGRIPDERYEHLCDRVYVLFWISRFPRLVTFLWLSLGNMLGSAWSQYYPVEWSIDLENERPDLQTFLNHFCDALQAIRTQGLMQARYSVNNKTLQFYQLSTSSIHNIHSTGSSTAILYVFPNYVNFYWNEDGSRLTYREELCGKNDSENCDLIGTTLAVLDQVYVQHLYNSVLHCSTDKIIYFTASSVDIVTDVIKKTSVLLDVDIQKVPLCLEEFNDSIRQKIYNSYVVIGESKKLVQLLTLLSFKDISKLVTDADLNILLQGSKMWLFPQFSLPEVNPCFVTRKLVPFKDQPPCTCKACRPDSPLFEQDNELSQTKLRKIVNKNEDAGQIIYIADKCGMGKSEIVRKVANEIFHTYKSKFVLVFAMRKFLEMVSKFCSLGSVKIEDIISFVSSHTCETELEENLVSLWFSSELRQRIKLEIFFDGLDEVSEELRNMSFSIINMIRENCPSIRLWITSRDHMAKDIQNRFQIQAFQLIPLSFGKSIMLTHKYCMCYLRQNYSTKEQRAKKVKLACYQYSLDCYTQLLWDDSDLNSVPLHCQMIAEFAMTKVMSRYIKDDLPEHELEKFRSKKNIITIYRHLIDKKFDFFLEKFNMEQNDTVGMYYRKMKMQDMIRTATLLSLVYVFGMETKEAFKEQLIPDQIAFKLVLDQFVQRFDYFVFCHRSICEFIVVDLILNVLTKGSYLGISKNDTNFKKLLWEKMLNLKFCSCKKMPYIIFKHNQLCKMFVWFCKKYADDSAADKLPSNLKWFPNYYWWIRNSEDCLLYFHFLTQSKITRVDPPSLFEFDHCHLKPWISGLEVMAKECNKMLRAINILSSKERAAQFKKWYIEYIIEIQESQAAHKNLFVVCVLVKLAYDLKNIGRKVVPRKNVFDRMVEENYVESLNQVFSDDVVERLLNQADFQSFEEIVHYKLPDDEEEDVEEAESDPEEKEEGWTYKRWILQFPFPYFFDWDTGKGRVPKNLGKKVRLSSDKQNEKYRTFRHNAFKEVNDGKEVCICHGRPIENTRILS